MVTSNQAAEEFWLSVTLRRPPRGLKIWRRFNLSSPPWTSIPNPRWWQVLGIAPTASPAEIRQQYHQLSRRYHPDLNPAPEAGAWMRAVNRAYESCANRG